MNRFVVWLAPRSLPVVWGPPAAGRPTSGSWIDSSPCAGRTPAALIPPGTTTAAGAAARSATANFDISRECGQDLAFTQSPVPMADRAARPAGRQVLVVDLS
jgi:hypothetical protein